MKVAYNRPVDYKGKEAEWYVSSLTPPVPAALLYFAAGPVSFSCDLVPSLGFAACPFRETPKPWGGKIIVLIRNLSVYVADDIF
jgi:hypothetical protein